MLECRHAEKNKGGKQKRQNLSSMPLARNDMTTYVPPTVSSRATFKKKEKKYKEKLLLEMISRRKIIAQNDVQLCWRMLTYAEELQMSAAAAQPYIYILEFVRNSGVLPSFACWRSFFLEFSAKQRRRQHAKMRARPHPLTDESFFISVQREAAACSHPLPDDAASVHSL